MRKFGDQLAHLEGAKTEVDPLRPGEQWFCYWKTSPSLWEGKILEIPSYEVIFIPIYWGFHAEGPSMWDFGEILPERDLLRLAKILTQHGRKFCWLIPVTPAPFLPNGGVPVSVAKTLSLSRGGVHLAVLDMEDKLNKMYSFFAPKVFQSYVEFLQALGKVLGKNQIKAPVWGGVFQYFENEKTVSYLEDHSVAFEQGFSRYLRQNVKRNGELDLNDPAKEESFKRDFISEVSELFKTTLETTLAPFWLGTQSITMLGSSPQETIQRSFSGRKSQLMYFKDLFEHYSHDRWISSALLGPKDKGEIFPKVLFEHFGTSEIERRFHYQVYGGDLTGEWVSFGLVEIYDNGEGQFKKTGPVKYLEQHYRWLYRILPDLDFSADSIDANQHKVKFFHAKGMDRTHFSQMLKLFMMGQKVIFDRSELSVELDKKLQVFFLENNLKLQTVNFVTNITLCELGEGVFITYDGNKLNNEQNDKFWTNVFNFLKLNHPDVKCDSEVFGPWRIRASTPTELNYLDVRRVNLYNPTSYKKHVMIHTRNFAFMKLIDPSKATAKSVTNGVEVELLPNGRIALDFGHYEEN